MLKNVFIGICSALVLSGALVAAHENAVAEPEQKAVIELFTSQGCSSCPPADKLLGKLARRDDVVALTFPVDYWDYLGWKDTLASPAFSARQRAYAKSRGDGEVYTPQVVVDGVSHAVGSRPSEVRQAIARSKRKLRNARVPLKLRTEGDSLVITVGAAPQGARVKPATVWLALVKKAETVKIARGENRGRTITYHKVVRDMTPIGQWTGKRVVIKLPKHHLQNRDADGCTVLLQQDTAGPVLAAVEMKTW
ncbi:MAG: DUF1223 domain-containing protein [Hyphomicrobiaceae bacterium]|nr:DUF1223 domain-containing protein [Hyphomicrobiaceae bacterium]